MASYEWPPLGSGTSGTVTSISVATANGFAGSVANPTTTPVITLSTTITGILQGDGTAISAATVGNLTSTPTTNLVVTGGTGAVLGSGVLLTLTGASLIESTSSILTITGGTNAVLGTGVSIQVKLAGAAQSGYLSSTDWNTFNNKQGAGSYITALTGDGTAAGPGSVALTLATVNSNVGSFTNASFTVNAKGLITAASSGTAPVTSISIATANGFAGSSGGGTTPILTLSTTITGILQGNGTAISAATLGNFTDVGTDGIVVTNGASAVLGSGTSIAQHVADSTHNGYLSSTDWSTFNGKGSGSVTSVAMTVPAFLSIAGSPVTTTGTLAVTLSGTALPIANGGTGVTSVTTAATASAFAGWDANKNLSANSLLDGYTTTATAAGTTTLVVGSTEQQYFTGSTTQTVVLPVTSTLVLGQRFRIINNSTGVITVQSSGANNIILMPRGSESVFTCILTSGTGVASWSCSYPNNLKFIAANTSGQTINNTQTTGWVTSVDTSSILHSGGDYVTIPITGFYWVSGTVSIDVPSASPLLDAQVKIYTDTGGGFALLAVGSSYGASLTYAAATSVSSIVTRLILCTAGDKIALWFQQDTGGARTMTTTAGYNHWSIFGVL